jgi:hypothetical protein
MARVEKRKFPDAKGAKVAQKTQKIQKENWKFCVAFKAPSTSPFASGFSFLVFCLFCVFCATFAPFASGIGIGFTT